MIGDEVMVTHFLHRQFRQPMLGQSGMAMPLPEYSGRISTITYVGFLY